MGGRGPPHFFHCADVPQLVVSLRAGLAGQDIALLGLLLTVQDCPFHISGPGQKGPLGIYRSNEIFGLL
jgi:hypothetical protein